MGFACISLAFREAVFTVFYDRDQVSRSISRVGLRNHFLNPLNERKRGITCDRWVAWEEEGGIAKDTRFLVKER